jgi:uncharacterized protein
MNQDLEHLIVLQAQDLDLGRLRAELAALPRTVSEAEATLAGARKKLAAVQQALSDEERLRRGQESEIATQRSKMERLRRSLDAATSAAQVTAFEHEIGFARTTTGKLEDEELASMERTEALEVEAKHAAAAVSDAEQRLEEQSARATRLTGELKEQIAGVESQRAELRAQVEPAVLSQYDRLSKNKGTAVAEALGNATQGRCSACQMGVRPQRWQDLTGREHQDQIFTCETCGRMLFWDPRRDSPRPWEAGDRLRKAQTALGTSGAAR